MQHVFHNDYTFEARYLGTRGVHLLVQQQINKTRYTGHRNRSLPHLPFGPVAGAS